MHVWKVEIIVTCHNGLTLFRGNPSNNVLNMSQTWLRGTPSDDAVVAARWLGELTVVALDVVFSAESRFTQEHDSCSILCCPNYITHIIIHHHHHHYNVSKFTPSSVARTVASNNSVFNIVSLSKVPREIVKPCHVNVNTLSTL